MENFFLGVVTKAQIRLAPLFSFRCGCWRKRSEATAPAEPCSPHIRKGLFPLTHCQWPCGPCTPPSTVKHSHLTLLLRQEKAPIDPCILFKDILLGCISCRFYSFQVQGCQKPSSSVSWRIAQISWSLYKSSTFIHKVWLPEAQHIYVITSSMSP